MFHSQQGSKGTAKSAKFMAFGNYHITYMVCVMYFVAPFMQSCLKTEFAAQSSLQCSVSQTGPVVNVVHEEDQSSVSFVSSSTSCVPTSEDHHVYTCTTTISNEVSLNVTEPKCSTDISSSGM